MHKTYSRILNLACHCAFYLASSREGSLSAAAYSIAARICGMLSSNSAKPIVIVEIGPQI